MKSLPVKIATSFVLLSMLGTSSFATAADSPKGAATGPSAKEILSMHIKFKTPAVLPADDLTNIELPTETSKRFSLRAILKFENPMPETGTITEMPSFKKPVATLRSILMYQAPGLTEQLADFNN